MVDTFDFCPGLDSQGTITQKVQTSNYGDGYSQATSVGINNQYEQWNITITGKASTIAPVRAFLDTHKGDQSFYWTPPNGKQGRYRSSEYQLTPQGNDVYKLSSTLTQVFDASSNAVSEYVKTVNAIVPDADGNVTLAAIDVGADDRGAAASSIAALKAEDDPLPQYAKKSDIPDLNYIDEKFTDLDGEIGSINTDIANLANDLGTTNNNLTSLEGRVTKAETNIGSLTTTVGDHTGQIGTLETNVSTNTTDITEIKSSMVKSVNNVLPDENGNVTLTVDPGSEIDDDVVATNKTWSSSKISGEITNVVDTINAVETSLDNKIDILSSDLKSLDVGKGADLIGYSDSVDYELGTVGNKLRELSNNTAAFVFVYPNGGTAESPANVASNTRYVMDNPFSGSPVIVITEILIDGIWGDSGTMYSSFSTSSDGGYGTKASHIIESDEIVVQTGRRGVAYMRASDSFGAHGSISTTTLATAPCRVKVWRVI